MDAASNSSMYPPKRGPQPPPTRRYVSFDIETTGPAVGKDVCFAVGWAWGSNAQDVRSGCVCLNLHKPSSINWKEMWEANGWSMQCYTEFWSKHLGILNMLQDPTHVTLCNSQEEMALIIEDALVAAEHGVSTLSFVTDTLTYDAYWVTAILNSKGFAALGLKRDGKYLRNFHLPSFRNGFFAVHPSSQNRPWFKHKQYKQMLCTTAPPHNHHPQNDARRILIEWFYLLSFL